MDDRQAAVERAFPELDHIEDDDLRDGVVTAWATAMADAGVDSLEDVPWYPPAQRELGVDDERLVDHVRDVTAGVVALAEVLAERRDPDLDLDVLVAGALVHDVSKVVEFDGMAETAVGDLLGHPHYGVHLVARVGLPVEVAHVLLAHTALTNVEPATIEAELVRRVDEAAANTIRASVLDDLSDY